MRDVFSGGERECRCACIDGYYQKRRGDMLLVLYIKLVLWFCLSRVKNYFTWVVNGSAITMDLAYFELTFEVSVLHCNSRSQNDFGSQRKTMVLPWSCLAFIIRRLFLAHLICTSKIPQSF